MSAEEFGIGEAARRLGCSVRKLQQWDLRGWCVADRNGARRRIYTPAHLEQVERMQAQGWGHGPKCQTADGRLTASGLARLLRVSAGTLHVWDKAGKLVAERTDAGKRRYTLAHLQQGRALLAANAEKRRQQINAARSRANAR